MAVPSFTVEAWSTRGSILTDFLFTPPRACECRRGGTRTPDLQVIKVERSPLDHTGTYIHLDLDLESLLTPDFLLSVCGPQLRWALPGFEPR